MSDISHDPEKTAAASAPTMSTGGADVDKKMPQQLDEGKIDAALAFLGAAEDGTVSEVDEKALVRKIDWRIVPLMCESLRKCVRRSDVALVALTM